jgi:hypothetical protein
VLEELAVREHASVGVDDRDPVGIGGDMLAPPIG